VESPVVLRSAERDFYGTSQANVFIGFRVPEAYKLHEGSGLIVGVSVDFCSGPKAPFDNLTRRLTNVDPKSLR
jgi:hypothetical protein